MTDTYRRKLEQRLRVVEREAKQLRETLHLEGLRRALAEAKAKEAA